MDRRFGHIIASSRHALQMRASEEGRLNTPPLRCFHRCRRVVVISGGAKGESGHLSSASATPSVGESRLDMK
jgi:hypothetical protein